MANPEIENKPSAENSGSLFLTADSGAFKEMFDSAEDAMLVIHRRGSAHCYVNRSACGLTGYTFGELTNMRFEDLVHREDLEKVEGRWNKQRTAMELPSRYEIRIVTKNKDVIPVEVTVTISRTANHLLSFAIVRDVRRKKRFEREMDKSLCMLKEKLERNRTKWKNLIMALFNSQQAVSVLANNIVNQKGELERRVNTTIASRVMPVIDELLAEKKFRQFWPKIGSMAEHLNNITTKSDFHLKAISVLTKMELKIAKMVKDKMTTSEIARALDISPETVQTHRRNIRKKLKIQHTRHKLPEYLETVIDH